MESQNQKDLLTQKQLRNVKKDIKYYQLDNARMQEMLANKLNIEIQTKLEEEEKHFERQIELFKKENRLLMIELKDKERKLANPKHEEAQKKKINFLIDEVSGLKKLEVANQKTQRWNEKNLKHQEEFIVVMQQKYEEICDKFDLEPGLNFKQFLLEQDQEEQLRDADRKTKQLGSKQVLNTSVHKDLTSKMKQTSTSYKTNTDLKSIQSKIKLDITDNLESIQEIEPTEDSVKTLVDKLAAWEKSQKAINKNFQAEIQQIQGLIKLQQENLLKANTQLKEKEKELEISKMKLEELQKLPQKMFKTHKLLKQADMKHGSRVYRKTPKQIQVTINSKNT